ncbi:MAG TPA: hypothetical protein VFV95_06910 [Vicinamibacterales bacterium]|nr:hypothetical protein [Vicinamibacterales bacterium]
MSATITVAPGAVNVRDVRPFSSWATPRGIYDVTSDGRVVSILPDDLPGSAVPTTIVTNWPAMLSRR